MKNRKLVDFVIYPRLFHSFSILYKGTYCVSFQIYTVSPSNSQTYAFPFIIHEPEHFQASKGSKNEKASLHVESNFSFQTEKFDIVYQEDTKRMKTECVFRAEFEYGKDYATYLSCKLLKKNKKKKQDQESGLCAPKGGLQGKFEIVDTQVIKINQVEQLNSHLRVDFNGSEFFSAVDLRICSFYGGIKLFKSKKQLSTMLGGFDLSKCDPLGILQNQKEKKEGRESKPQYMSLRDLKDISNEIMFAYNQLQNMVSEYTFWRNQIIHFREKVLTQYDLEGRRLTPFTFEKLTYLNRGNFIKAEDVKKAYGLDRQDQALAAVFEEKEIVRYNIRALREYFCVLLFHEPLKRFKELITQSQREEERVRQDSFVKFKANNRELVESDQRDRASQDFSGSINFCIDNLERIPYLLVEGYEKQRPKKVYPNQTLTVFVHGYQGNSFDFQKSKNYLKKYNKHTTVLIAESITKDMDRSIEELGQKVAEEVIKFVDRSLNEFEKINFIGFSLGGLLVRSCLASLGYLRNKLGIFVTFSSPHLGISESDNSLVNLGVWYLIKVDKVKNLKELNFQSVDLQDSLLMKLSKCPFISKFTKVILVSSKNDGFVPLYSTFLEKDLCQNEVVSLCNNLRSQIRRLERVEVQFNTDHAGTLDKLTGRRGHIEFLDNHYFLDMFFRLYGPFF